MITMFFFVNLYVKAKDKRLRDDIYKKIEEIFDGKWQLIDVYYSGYQVNYHEVNVPLKPIDCSLNEMERISYNENYDFWIENFCDIKTMYCIHYDTPMNKHEDGWNLIQIIRDEEGVSIYTIFPYAVGYITQNHQKHSWLDDDYTPSVQSAVDVAFTFFTTNEKSQFYKYYEKGSYERFFHKILDAANDYYCLSYDIEPRTWRIGPCLFHPYEKNYTPNSHHYGSMYNAFYRVFIAESAPKTYTIKKYEYNPDMKDKIKMWTWWGIGLTVLLFLIVIPLSIAEKKTKKIIDECLYDKLKRLCNPANFIKNYDKDKVDKANAIYTNLISISPDDELALNILQERAVKELDINLIDELKLADLKEKVNPQRFMNPYNPKKVTLANELYAILMKKELTYSEMSDVEKKAKQLY